MRTALLLCCLITLLVFIQQTSAGGKCNRCCNKCEPKCEDPNSEECEQCYKGRCKKCQKSCVKKSGLSFCTPACAACVAGVCGVQCGIICCTSPQDVCKSCLINKCLGQCLPTCLGGPKVAKYIEEQEGSCYQDFINHRTLPHNLAERALSMSPSICRGLCRKAGYGYAGVEYGNECWCGSSAPPATRKVDMGNCDMTCAGNSQFTCGASLFLNIYSSAGCKPGWVQFNEKCYYFPRFQSKNWANARSTCQSLLPNSDLTVILSDHEMNFIHKEAIKLSITRFWVGAKRYSGNNGNNLFKWTTGEDVPANYFLTGEPSGDGDCVELVSDARPGGTVGLLNDRPCSDDEGDTYVCQVAADP